MPGTAAGTGSTTVTDQVPQGLQTAKDKVTNTCHMIQCAMKKNNVQQAVWREEQAERPLLAEPVQVHVSDRDRPQQNPLCTEALRGRVPGLLQEHRGPCPGPEGKALGLERSRPLWSREEPGPAPCATGPRAHSGLPLATVWTRPAKEHGKAARPAAQALPVVRTG